MKKKGKKMSPTLESNLKMARRLSRERALERAKMVGEPRVKLWGGKDVARDDRRKWKDQARKGRYES